TDTDSLPLHDALPILVVPDEEHAAAAVVPRAGDDARHRLRSDLLAGLDREQGRCGEQALAGGDRVVDAGEANAAGGLIPASGRPYQRGVGVIFVEHPAVGVGVETAVRDL